MIFNDHSAIKESNAHAFLGASQHSWIRYDDDALLHKLETYRASQKGTELHAFAELAINLGQKLGGPNSSLKMHVNDAIGYKMTPEVVLYYSPYCFGTADAISFRRNKLRIHDLKTGTTVKGSMEQLMIYAAYFCLEYKMKPSDIEIELRIYQFEEASIYIPTSDEIMNIIDKVIYFNKMIVDNAE